MAPRPGGNSPYRGDVAVARGHPWRRHGKDYIRHHTGSEQQREATHKAHPFGTVPYPKNDGHGDRDDEMLTPSDDLSLIAFLNKKRVDVVVIKPENQTAMNLAIEIDDFPPPL